MKKRPAARSALNALEEAVDLLRRAPGGTLAGYYIGALPFVLGLLYFWADMSRSAFAYEHAVEASSTIAALFVWMKCAQAIFCANLRAVAARTPPPRWNARRLARLAFAQAAWQPLALFTRPVAALITLPYVWVFAFFQNVLVFGDGTDADLRRISRRAIAQAKLWPREHHLAHSILLLFGSFVWFNVVIAMLVLPSLLKSLFGLETPLTRSAWGMVNSTFFAASCAAAYLCVNPITQAFYVLRCFYGESLQTGEDLRVELARLGKNARLATAAVLLLIAQPLSAHAAPAPRAIEAAELDHSIENVLNRREYTWRMPREPIPKSERSWLQNFVEGIIKTVHGWIEPLKKWIERIIEWMIDYANRHRSHDDNANKGKLWLQSLRWLLYGLIAATAAVFFFLLWKRWKTGGRAIRAVAQGMPAVPDLASENVTADQLPEDGWLQLARELSERGDLRLALRALYLAGLAHLGARELIILAKHKSNRDYERDLRRRARSRTDLLGVFDENMNAFERVWYGLHEVTRDTLSHFTANLEKIRAC